MHESGSRLAALVEQAKTDEQAAAALLMPYRSYLMLLARGQIGRRLGAKASASDVVQDALVQALRALPSFAGKTEQELLAWLRKILSSRIVQLLRRYTTEKRDHRLEERLQFELDRSGAQLSGGLPAATETPSQQLQQRERALELADALEALSPDYREVVLLHHVEGLAFDEVAKRMGRTPGSAQKLWVRALAKLRHALAERE